MKSNKRKYLLKPAQWMGYGFCVTILPLLVLAGSDNAENRFLEWQCYETPEMAGWSSEELIQTLRNANASSAFLVYDGKVVYTYGEYWRRFKIHSIRKSILSALFGIALDENRIDSNASLSELIITDHQPLTENEMKARIVDLLRSKSGVYLPASAESAYQQRTRPPRGAYGAGEYFYYNNWDFNALGTIYRQATGKDIFEEFLNRIARPIGMEDFQLIDGCYNYESVSMHPAYNFQLSARDLARFGQLFLQSGNWNGDQIISEAWIRKSTSPMSGTRDQNIVTGDSLEYGYLWWVIRNYKGYPLYYAAGNFGQRLVIIPSMKIVLVVQSNTYVPENVSDVDFVVDDIIFKARVSEPAPRPSFVLLERPPDNQFQQLDIQDLQKYCRAYDLDGSTAIVNVVGGALILTNYHYSYNFRLMPVTPELFHVEDIDMYMFFELDEEGFPVKVEIHKSQSVHNMLKSIVGDGMEETVRQFPVLRAQIKTPEELIYLSEELDKRGIDNIEVMKFNALCFPDAFNIQERLRNALAKRYDLAYTAGIFGAIVQTLKPEGKARTKCEWLYEIIRSQAFPQALNSEDADIYAGEYGSRHISADDGALYYYVDPNSRTRLFRISENEFSFQNQFHRRVEFDKDDKGRVIALVIHYYRNTTERSPKTR